MTRCRIPEFSERFKIDIGIYDPKSNEYSLGMLNKEIYVYTFIKNHYCVVWKTNRRDSLLGGRMRWKK